MQDDSRKLPTAVADSSPPVISTPANPAWAKDLRQLYNAVVEEPLPASFLALLSQLDSAE